MIDKEHFEDIQDDTETPCIASTSVTDPSSAAPETSLSGPELSESDALMDSMTDEQFEELSIILEQIEVLEGLLDCMDLFVTRNKQQN